MRRLIDRCAGIDVGQALWVVRVRVVDGSRLVEEVRSFGATTPDLVALRDWLVGLGVTCLRCAALTSSTSNSSSSM
jgi:transposase